jgi:hypothetical protein
VLLDISSGISKSEETPTKLDIWADYDPEKVKQGLQRSAGALAGIDRDALQRDIQSQLQQDSDGLSCLVECSLNLSTPETACFGNPIRYPEKTCWYNHAVFRKVILSGKKYL